MANFNEVTLVGHVGRNAEMRYTDGGKAVAGFSVAVSENRGDDSQTQWFEVTTWEKLAETCNEYVTKGMQVLVKGRVYLDKWKDNDDINKSRLAVTASKVLFLSPKRENGSESSDLPF